MPDTLTPGLGHNSGIPFRDRVDDALEKFDQLPKVLSDQDEARTLIDAIKRLRLLGQDLEAAMKDEQEPLKAEIAAIGARYLDATMKLAEQRDALMERLRKFMVQNELKTVRSLEGHSAYWKAAKVKVEVGDPAKVPLSLWAPDPKLIAEFIEAGFELPPGVRVTSGKSLIVA